MPTDLAALPKVVLHDHLDGGLRPKTVLELAAECGYTGLPTTDLEQLEAWFYQGRSASLERYLEAFVHTVAVMQTAEGLERVAYEAAEDLSADGVVYAEVRMAPSLCIEGGLDRSQVLDAILAGLARGSAEFGIEMRFIADAMRQEGDSVEVVAAALEFRDRGVVGFDLAGPEAGYPAGLHRRACESALEGGLHLTIHAGEGDGVSSIAGALEVGAERLGHGARIVEDIEFADGRPSGLGTVAQTVLDRSIPLEMCPTSNLHTGMYATAANHPVGVLHRSGFAVTLNTDNRLMSRIEPSDEFRLVLDHQGFDVADLHASTVRAMDAAFCDDATRKTILRRVEAGYS